MRWVEPRLMIMACRDTTTTCFFPRTNSLESELRRKEGRCVGVTQQGPCSLPVPFRCEWQGNLHYYYYFLFILFFLFIYFVKRHAIQYARPLGEVETCQKVEQVIMGAKVNKAVTGSRLTQEETHSMKQETKALCMCWPRAKARKGHDHWIQH